MRTSQNVSSRGRGCFRCISGAPPHPPPVVPKAGPGGACLTRHPLTAVGARGRGRGSTGIALWPFPSSRAKQKRSRKKQRTKRNKQRKEPVVVVGGGVPATQARNHSSSLKARTQRAPPHSSRPLRTPPRQPLDSPATVCEICNSVESPGAHRASGARGIIGTRCSQGQCASQHQPGGAAPTGARQTH